MKINKKIGHWSDNKDVTYLDNVAYYLYVNNIYTNITKRWQVTFISEHYEYNRFNNYYNLATQIIRRNKIEKILKHIEN